MKNIIGYWEVWHFALALVLFMWIYMGRPPFDLMWMKIGRDPYKQLTFLLVLGMALGWEIIELLTGLEAYSGVKHFVLNSYKDMGMALLGSFLCVLMLD